jgi:GNAT superfamily N-acetyltransferase
MTFNGPPKEKTEAKAEHAYPKVELPEVIAEQFLAGTLSDAGQVVHEDEKSKTWRLFEQEIEVPSVGKALLRVDYRKVDDHVDPPFDQVRFDIVAAEAKIDGIHPRIAEMYFFRDEGRFGNQYPYDLMQVHRYVDPEYRNRRGVGTYLYEQSELWAKQVARKKGMDLRIALSTDQPDTMNWAEKRGYAPYPEEADKRKEVLEHLDRFTLIDESDVGGQARNTAIERDGKRVRLWFEKTIRA